MTITYTKYIKRGKGRGPRLKTLTGEYIRDIPGGCEIGTNTGNVEKIKKEQIIV